MRLPVLPSLTLVLSAQAQDSSTPKAVPAIQSIADAMARPWGKLFWIGRNGSAIRATASGPDGKAIRLEVTVAIEDPGGRIAVTVDGKQSTKSDGLRYLGRESIRALAEVPAGKTATIVVSGRQ